MKKLSAFLFGVYVLILALFSLSKSVGFFRHQIQSLQDFLGGDKSTHLVAAVFLGGIASFIIDYRHAFWLKKAITVFLAVICLVSLDEFLQFFLKTRVFDLYDLYYGLFGVFCGFPLGLMLNLYFFKLKKPVENSR